MNKGMAIGGAGIMILFGISATAAASYRSIEYIPGGYRVYTIKPEVIAFLGLMTIVGIVLMIVGLAIEGRRPAADLSFARYLDKMDDLDKQEQGFARPLKAPRFCPQCGEALQDPRARFCAQCGERLA